MNNGNNNFCKQDNSFRGKGIAGRMPLEFVPTFKYSLRCPFCMKGEILADNKAKITVSTVCPVCNNLYYADLYSMRTFRPKELRKMGKIRPLNNRLSCPYNNCMGEVRTNGQADVHISLHCAKKHCHQYYIVDLKSLKTYPSKPVKRLRKR